MLNVALYITLMKDVNVCYDNTYNGVSKTNKKFFNVVNSYKIDQVYIINFQRFDPTIRIRYQI